MAEHLRSVARVGGHVDEAFERYAALVRQAEGDVALRTSLSHSMAIVRAWATWRDAFLAMDRAA